MRALSYLAVCITLVFVSPADARMGGTAAPGETGPAGPAGAKGEKGEKGDAGPSGARGEAGAAGQAGPTGPAGQAGKDGATGPAGQQGLQGSAGPAGKDGIAGAPGAQGPQGIAGKDGVAGAQGATGPAGKDGGIGPQGIQGPTGATGPTGPKASTFVCNATLTETAVSILGSGLRVTPEVTCAGLLTSDVLEVYPLTLSSLGNAGAATASQGYSANYAVHHAFPTAAGKMRAEISFPGFLALGAVYSIPVAVYSVNR